MILSNDGLVAFHYRSYGTFFLHKNRLHNIYRRVPTTNIIESFYRSEYQKRKDKMCPSSILAFLQPDTVDKESKLNGE